mmetsp:Transcript_14388/g.36786  ORF Transcript_14388/g.36786 Transcript_14388/m.36786 type:complete len:302 (+) Transcript_14388:875-1780(+)
MGTMRITAPGSSEWGARTFVVRPATTKPGAMPMSGGSTMKMECSALTVMATSSTLGTRKRTGMRIMPTRTSNALAWALLFSLPEPCGSVNIARRPTHSCCRISAAFSTWPISNCCAASRQPMTAFSRLPWHSAVLPTQGMASCSGMTPRIRHVFCSVLPKPWSCFSKPRVVISWQLPSSSSWALSKFMATASSWTYSSASASARSKESIRRIGKRLTRNGEANAKNHAMRMYRRLLANDVHALRASSSMMSGTSSITQTQSSEMEAPRSTSPTMPASIANAFWLLYSRKLGFTGLPTTQAS